MKTQALSVLRRAFCIGAAILLAAATARAANSTLDTPTPPAAAHRTFVIVHGAFGGGWAFREVDQLLTAKGHKVYRPTLTGQGEKVHLATRDTDLATHVNDIVNVILFEDLHDIVLVGHSYGGMVITGVMDRVPERISQVIFLDAAVPEDGENMCSWVNFKPTPEQLATGFYVPPWRKSNAPLPHDVPQPMKTWTEPVSFKNPLAKKIPGAVVVFVGGKQTPEDLKDHPGFVRAKARGWATFTLQSDHNAQWSHPKQLVALLDQIATGNNADALAKPAEAPHAK